MRLSIAALLLLLASCLSPGHGILEAHYTNFKCKCLRTISNFIHPSLIERIQIIPPGNGCPKSEVMIWTKNGKVLCVNPFAKWLKILVRYFQSKNMSITPQLQ